jgi:hypothetical protein
MHDRHIVSVSIAEAQKLIAAVNKQLADAFDDLAPLERQISRRAGTQQHLFVARYSYGQLLAGPRDALPMTHLGGFLPPCGERSDACKPCKTLLAELGNERPLCIGLTHVIEEFLRDHTQESSYSHFERVAPNRLVRSGEYVNLAETLNSLIDPDFPKGAFKAPVRNASAGIHSAYLTAPIGNKDLRLALKTLWKSTLSQEPDVKWWNSDWKDSDFLKIASQIGLVKARSSWEVQIIIIPVAWLRACLFSGGALRSESKSVLLHLLTSGWKETRGLRSTLIRHLTLSEIGRELPGRIIAEKIVGRLLLILRGDAPGFRPAVLDDENLPLSAIWQTLIGNKQIQEKFFADHFPGVIEPFHLNRRASIPKGTFFYYPLSSFEQLGDGGSLIDELDAIEAVNDLLVALQIKNPEMLGRIKWELFASPAPLESKFTKVQSVTRRTRKISVPFTSAELSEVIHKDFEPQLKSASRFGSVPARVLPKPPRKGFLRRFIRVSVS